MGAAQNSSRLIAKDDVRLRIDELKRTISEGVVKLEIRERSARVQILQNNLDHMRQVIAARTFEHSAHPGAATGLLAKDYRGKNSEKEIWKFDAALVSQMNEVLKQAAIEEGQWTEKRELSGLVSVAETKARLNGARDRLAAAKKAALEKGLPWP